jgi:hypothetical protein
VDELLDEVLLERENEELEDEVEEMDEDDILYLPTSNCPSDRSDGN